jgi:hypothetical protein
MKASPLPLNVASGLPDEADSAVPGVGRFPEETIEHHSALRHGRHYGRAACLAHMTAMRLHQALPEPPDRLGILCNGGPWHVQSAWNLASRAYEAGPDFINPLVFPATLVSATPAAAAAAVGAHAFAYAVGHDRLAFFDVLGRAAQAVRHNLADCVFALAVSASGGIWSRAADRAGLPEPLDVAIGFALTSPGRPGQLQLLAAGWGEPAVPDVDRYEAAWTGSRMACRWKTPLAHGDALGASGAVLCVAAARDHQNKPEALRRRPFVVVAREDLRYGHAVMQWC